MNAKEKYLFDLQGFIVIKNVLNAKQLANLNRAIDKKLERGEQITNGFLNWEESYFRDLICEPAISPYLNAILGEHYRLDHEYAIVHRKGANPLGLHGGGTPYDQGQFYHVRNDVIYSGLSVVSYSLSDIGPDDGGFCCIPGSHKSNFKLPEEYRHFSETGPTVHIPMKAGDVLIFTEALTHGTFPWQAEHERRSLLFKYSPRMIAWAKFNRSEELLARLTPEQQGVVKPVYRQTENEIHAFIERHHSK